MGIIYLGKSNGQKEKGVRTERVRGKTKERVTEKEAIAVDEI